jgi:hypothetical protein
MSKTRECLLRNNASPVCDDIINGTVLVTEMAKIPKTNLNMNLVGKLLCRYHYNTLIVNENHRLTSMVKQ